MNKNDSIRDISLQSSVMWLPDDGLPSGTCKLMFVYDGRGWAIRCYDQDGNKLDTLYQDPNRPSSLVSAKN